MVNFQISSLFLTSTAIATSSSIVHGGTTDSFMETRNGKNLRRRLHSAAIATNSGIGARKLDDGSSNGHIITLGDSFSSGTGIHPDGDQYDEEFGGYVCINEGTDNEECYQFTPSDKHNCWRELDTTPGPMLAEETSKESIFLACKSARVEHVQAQVDYLKANPDWETNNSDGWEDSVVLLTAGGNDLRTYGGEGWTGLLTTCVTDTDCHKEDENQIENWDEVKESLKGLYESICDATSSSESTKVRVLGYARMLQPDPLCAPVPGFSPEEGEWADELLDTLNDKIEEAIDEVHSSESSACFNKDIQFVDVDDGMKHGGCHANSFATHVRGFVFHTYDPTSLSASTLHPSQRGYNVYYDSLLNTL